jgi:hypothetical protein
MTAKGHPRSISTPAVEHGNLMLAETALGMGFVPLGEALALTVLAVEEAPGSAEPLHGCGLLHRPFLVVRARRALARPTAAVHGGFRVVGCAYASALTARASRHSVGSGPA